MTGQDDYAARLMEDMDPRLLEFIRKRVNSFIKWDLVRFFYDNPHTADTAANIARYTGREAGATEKELLSLTEAGILQTSRVSNMTVFTLATDEEVRALIRRFILACEDRQFRIKAIYHVIQGMR